MNPNTGKRERIFVDLATLYPTPDVQGSELSFEEVWAMNKGWLNKDWDEEPSVDENMQFDENAPEAYEAGRAGGVEALSKGVAEKLVIHRDAGPGMHDENSAAKPKPAGEKLMIHRDPEPAVYDENSAPKPARKAAGEKLMIHRDPEPAMYDENSAPKQAPKPVGQKLMIHRDSEPAMYDENGAVKEAPRGKPKKIRRMEVNETQTSESFTRHVSWVECLANNIPVQSRRSLIRRQGQS